MDTSIVPQKRFTVYLVTNRVNGKKYVGITIQSIDARLNAHFSKARITSDNRKFYNAIRKYGEENFYIELLDRADSYTELKEKEKHYIKTLDTYNSGYNSTFGGDGTLGASPNDEVREKHRAHKKAYFANQENRDRYSKMNAVFSDEQIIEMCDMARTGELNSFELADLFGTTEPTVSEIITGKLYKHVKREPLPKRGIEKARMEAKRKKLLSLYADGLSYADIGEKVGLDSNTVWRNLKSILGDSPVSADMRQIEQRNGKIVSERLLGKTVREISSTVGISVDVVRRELKKAGIYKPDDPRNKSRSNQV